MLAAVTIFDGEIASRGITKRMMTREQDRNRQTLSRGLTRQTFEEARLVGSCSSFSLISLGRVVSSVSVDQRDHSASLRNKTKLCPARHPGEEGLVFFPSRHSIPSCSSLNRENSTGLELLRWLQDVRPLPLEDIETLLASVLHVVNADYEFSIYITIMSQFNLLSNITGLCQNILNCLRVKR